MADGLGGFSDVTPGPAVWCDVDGWDPAAIEPRPWIASGYFLRKHVTTLIGPGGISKSSLVLAYMVALGLGREFHSMQPMRAFRSMVYNAEDDAEEQRRRLTATLVSFGTTPPAIRGMIARTGPSKVGTLFQRDPETGEVVPTAAMMRLEQLVIQHSIDILFVDPLAELHTCDENDNTAMRAIVAAFRELAQRCSIAVCIVHHTRKGIATPGDPDMGRGASAIIGASRVVLTLTGMTSEEADAFGLPEHARKHFFRVDGGKANYSSVTDAEWFERSIYTLENGDTVAVPVPWAPPLDRPSLEIRFRVEAMIRRGSPLGPWSPKLDKRPRSIKQVMVECGVTTARGQADLLAALLQDGFEIALFRDAQRKAAQGIRALSGEPSDAEWIARE